MAIHVWEITSQGGWHQSNMIKMTLYGDWHQFDTISITSCGMQHYCFYYLPHQLINFCPHFLVYFFGFLCKIEKQFQFNGYKTQFDKRRNLEGEMCLKWRKPLSSVLCKHVQGTHLEGKWGCSVCPDAYLLEITNASQDFKLGVILIYGCQICINKLQLQSCRLQRSHFPYPMSFNKKRFQLNGFNNMHEWIGIFLKAENCGRDVRPSLSELASNQWPILFFFYCFLQDPDKSLPQIPPPLPLLPAQKLAQIIKIVLTE